MKIEAELLVKCGYAEMTGRSIDRRLETEHLTLVTKDYRKVERCNPYTNTFEGRQQADALEDWLWEKETIHWRLSIDMVLLKSSNYQWRLDRIKWCCKQIGKQNST